MAKKHGNQSQYYPESKDWDAVIDSIQYYMIWFIIVLTAVSMASLILFDMLAGAGVMMYLSGNRLPVAVGISFATSGLLMTVMFISYTVLNSSPSKGKKKNFSWKTIISGLAMGTVVLGAISLDVYFDSLTADYLRFGMIVVLSNLPEGDVQILFRTLIGSLSVVGEPLAIAMILGMPVLKGILSSSLPSKKKHKGNQSQAPYPKRPTVRAPKNEKGRGREDAIIKERFNEAQRKRDQTAKTSHFRPAPKTGQAQAEPTYHNLSAISNRQNEQERRHEL